MERFWDKETARSTLRVTAIVRAPRLLSSRSSARRSPSHPRRRSVARRPRRAVRQASSPPRSAASAARPTAPSARAAPSARPRRRGCARGTMRVPRAPSWFCLAWPSVNATPPIGPPANNKCRHLSSGRYAAQLRADEAAARAAFGEHASFRPADDEPLPSPPPHIGGGTRDPFGSPAPPPPPAGGAASSPATPSRAARAARATAEGRLAPLSDLAQLLHCDAEVSCVMVCVT